MTPLLLQLLLCLLRLLHLTLGQLPADAPADPTQTTTAMHEPPGMQTQSTGTPQLAVAQLLPAQSVPGSGLSGGLTGVYICNIYRSKRDATLWAHNMSKAKNHLSPQGGGELGGRRGRLRLGVGVAAPRLFVPVALLPLLLANNLVSVVWAPSARGYRQACT